MIAYRNFEPLPSPRQVTLILGGTHGDEPATDALVTEFCEFLPSLAVQGLPVIAWPLVNPDGRARGTRYNAVGVDLNRNTDALWSADSEERPGPFAWSEPESRALRDLILHWRPAKIVTLHWALAELDADGIQSRGLLDAMWDALSDSERQPYRCGLSKRPSLPGSFGSWIGHSVRYPGGTAPAIVTLELPAEPESPRQEELAADHLATVHARWRNDANGYLAAVRPGVMKMLLAACACPA